MKRQRSRRHVSSEFFADENSLYYMILGRVIKQAMDDFNTHYRNGPMASRQYDTAEWYLFHKEGLAMWIEHFDLPLNIERIRRTVFKEASINQEKQHILRSKYNETQQHA